MGLSRHSGSASGVEQDIPLLSSVAAGDEESWLAAADELIESARPKTGNRAKAGLAYARRVSLPLLLLLMATGCTIVVVSAVPLTGYYFGWDVANQAHQQNPVQHIGTAGSVVPTNRWAYAMWLILIYYVTLYYTTASGAWLQLYRYSPILYLAWGVPFIVMIALLFRFCVFPSVFQFAFGILGAVWSIVPQIMIAFRNRCRSRSVQPRHWIMWTANIVSLYSLYYFCTIFLRLFSFDSGRFQTLFSLLFQVFGMVQRFVVSRVSRWHPSAHNRRLYNVGEMTLFISHLIFFTFYRAVFREISAAWVIVVMQATNALLELLQYVLWLSIPVQRAKRLLLTLLGGLLRCLPVLHPLSNALLEAGSAPHNAAPLRRLLDSLSRATPSGAYRDHESLLDGGAGETASATDGGGAAASLCLKRAYVRVRSAAGLCPKELREELRVLDRVLSQPVPPGTTCCAHFERAIETAAQTEHFRSASIEYVLRHLANLSSITVFLVMFGLPQSIPWVSVFFQLPGSTTDSLAVVLVCVSLVVDLLLVLVVALLWRFLFGRSLFAHFSGFMQQANGLHRQLGFLYLWHSQMDLVVTCLNLPVIDNIVCLF